MKKFFTLLIIFLLAFIIFMPKDNLYYTLKNILKKERVTITQEVLNDNLLALNAIGISIFYDGVDSVKVDSFSVKPYLFYNKIKLKNVSAADDLKKMFSFSANSVDISYAVWDYKHINIEAEGDFGEISGSFDIINRSIKLILEPALRFEKSQLINQYFKKSDEGYIYESKIK